MKSIARFILLALLVSAVSAATLFFGQNVNTGSPNESNLVANGTFDVGTVTAKHYSGQRAWSNAAPKTIDDIDIMLTKGGGTIAGITYVCEIWTLSSNNLNAVLQTSSSVTGDDSWNGTFVRFHFPSPVATTGGVPYAITVRNAAGIDATNYATMSYNTGTSGSIAGSRDQWDTSKNFQLGASGGIVGKLYYH